MGGGCACCWYVKVEGVVCCLSGWRMGGACGLLCESGRLLGRGGGGDGLHVV